MNFPIKLWALFAALGLSSPANALYTLTDLGPLDDITSYGAGINIKGQLTGSTYAFSNNEHAFVTNAKTHIMRNLGTLGGITSQGIGINNKGRVAGFLITPSHTQHAFVTEIGTHNILDLGTLPGGRFSYATGINGKGQVTGGADTEGGGQHAFVTELGTNKMIKLGTESGYGVAININGQVTGSFTTSTGDRRAFVTEIGTNKMINLGVLSDSDYSYSYGAAINDKGQVTGYSSEKNSYGYQAFVTQIGTNKMIPLGLDSDTLKFYGDSPTEINSYGLGINYKGQVTGYLNSFSNGYSHAFVAINNVITDLNTLVIGTKIGSRFLGSSGWELNKGVRINYAGQITGFATVWPDAPWPPAFPTVHAFLLTPVTTSPVAQVNKNTPPPDASINTASTEQTLDATDFRAKRAAVVEGLRLASAAKTAVIKNAYAGTQLSNEWIPPQSTDYIIAVSINDSNGEITIIYSPKISAGSPTLVLSPRDGGNALVAGMPPLTGAIVWECNSSSPPEGSNGSIGTIDPKLVPVNCKS